MYSKPQYSVLCVLVQVCLLESLQALVKGAQLLCYHGDKLLVLWRQLHRWHSTAEVVLQEHQRAIGRGQGREGKGEGEGEGEGEGRGGRGRGQEAEGEGREGRRSCNPQEG